MHIGNLRTALFAFLTARRYGGTFILRIEDTDQERNIPESLEAIYSSLAMAGLVYDEGPDKDGGYGPYVQSQRLEIYKHYANELLTLGGGYRCFCQKDDTDSFNEDLSRRDPCRLLSPEEVKQKLDAGESFVIRQKIPETGSTSFVDHVYGEIKVENAQLDDQVLIKSDGFPTYNFANVVDDHLMRITHVMRGQEYLSSTPKYNLLYQTFGWTIPEYVHLPLIIKSDGSKFSKREGDPSFEDLMELGYLPEAIINYIALLGWSPGDDREFFMLDELEQFFSIDRINKSSAAFSFDKLNWINGEHIRAMSIERFHQRALNYYPAGLARFDMLKISELMQIRTEKMRDIPDMVAFFLSVPGYDLDLYNHEKSKSTQKSSLEVLQAVKPLLMGVEVWNNETLFQVLKEFAEENGYKVGTVMWPIRTALSGVPATPGGATAIAEILGKTETLQRIGAGIEKLKQGTG